MIGASISDILNNNVLLKIETGGNTMSVKVPGVMWGIASLLAVSACATTEASSAATVSGLLSNTKSAQATFEGTFYDTLDMAKVEEGHYVVTDADYEKLALTEDPRKSAKGFIAMAHAASYIETGASRNLVTDPSIVEPLNRIRDRLLAAWDGPAPDIQIFVSGEQGYHGNAFQQNFIIIPVGAIAAIADDREEINGEPNLPGEEDELAAFMAHEMAHILLGHYQRGLSASYTDKLNNGAAAISTVGVVLGNAELIGSGDQKTIQIGNEKKATEQMESLLIGHAILKQTNLVLSASASREQEDHADLLAMDLLARAGYNPEQVSVFLDRSRQAQVSQELDLQKMSDEQKVLASAFSQKLGGGQGNFLTDLGVTVGLNMMNSWMNKASATHRSTEKRIENVSGYSERLATSLMPRLADGSNLGGTEGFYLASFSASEESTDGLGADLTALRSDHAASLLDAYRKAFEAERYIQSSDEEVVAKAGALLNEAVTVAPKEPQILLIVADYFTRTGNARLAADYLEVAVAQPSSGPLNYATLASAYYASGQYEKMEAAIVEGEKKVGTEVPFLHLRISLLAQQKKWGEAVATYEKCKATEAQGIIQNCNAAMVPVDAELERQRAQKATDNPFMGLFGKKD